MPVLRHSANSPWYEANMTYLQQYAISNICRLTHSSWFGYMSTLDYQISIQHGARAHYIWLHLSRLGSRGWVLTQPQFFGLELRAPMGTCQGQYSISVRYASRKFLRGYTLHNFPFVPD